MFGRIFYASHVRYADSATGQIVAKLRNYNKKKGLLSTKIGT